MPLELTATLIASPFLSFSLSPNRVRKSGEEWIIVGTKEASVHVHVMSGVRWCIATLRCDAPLAQAGQLIVSSNSITVCGRRVGLSERLANFKYAKS